MSKVPEHDRCELFHKRGSRHTRCPRTSEMSYRVVDLDGQVSRKRKGEPYDLRICHEDFKLEPLALDAVCLETLRMNPPKQDEEPQP